MSVLRVVITFCLLFLVGCAGVSKKNIQLSTETGNLLTNQSLVVSKRPQPDFSAFTPSSALLGAIGGAMTISRGNRIVTENQIADPAVFISSTLSNDLMNKYKVNIGSDGAIVTGTEVAKIASQFSHSKYILDVQTVRWGYIYFPTHWDRYKVLYIAKLRLIDRENQTIVSEGYCESNPEFNDETAPTGEELLANNAKVLKEISQQAANYCLSEFRANALAIGSQFATEPKVVTNSSSNTQALLEVPKPSTNTAVPTSDSGSGDKVANQINLSGNYISEITTDHVWTFKSRYRKLKLTLKDDGENITVTNTSPSVKLYVTRKGDVLSFSINDATTQCGCNYVNGEWKVNASGTRFEGTWKRSGGVDGEWTLKKRY